MEVRLYVDAHAHLDKYADEELPGVLGTLEDQRILTLSVSVDVPSFVRTEEIAARSEWVVPAFGVQPSNALTYAGSLSDLATLVDRGPMIGEIGLDHRLVTDESRYPAQREVFEWFLGRAREEGKLVSVHCVGAEKEGSRRGSSGCFGFNRRPGLPRMAETKQ